MSITEIAKRAGVSISTVSLVMNNKSSIPVQTADRVRAAMRDLNYSPSPARQRHGRPLKTNTGLRLGLISDVPTAWLRSPVYVDAIHGVEEAARQGKATMLLLHSPAREDLERLHGKVDGLIVLARAARPDDIAPLSHLPRVQTFGTYDPSTQADLVTTDNAAIGLLAANFVLAEGHRHVASLSVDGEPFDARMASYRDAIERDGGGVLDLAGATAIKIRGDEQYADHEKVGELIDRLLAAVPRPTAIFLAFDLFAPTVYLQLLARGIRPGVDIQVVTCNNELALIGGLHPRPAAIDIHARQIGQSAVERLLWRMEHPDARPALILVQPELVA